MNKIRLFVYYDNFLCQQCYVNNCNFFEYSLYIPLLLQYIGISTPTPTLDIVLHVFLQKFCSAGKYDLPAAFFVQLNKTVFYFFLSIQTSFVDLA